MDIDRDNRFMTLALNLLERVREEYYQLECMDYWDNDMLFDNIPNNSGHKLVDIVTKSERYDEFLSKYPSSVRAVIKKHGEHYNQDSILHHDGKTATLHGTNKTGFPGHGKTEPVGKMAFNKAHSPFQTETKPKGIL